MSCLSIDLRFKSFWMSNDLRFKWFGCQLMCDSSDFVKRSFSARLPPKRRFEAQKRSFCARLPSKMKLWRSKTKLLRETSFKNEALEDQKRSFSARLPSKMKLWRSKTKLLCETSFKNEALKLKNEAFLRDFLQKWSFTRSKAKHFCETSFKNYMLTRHLTSEFQNGCFKNTAPATKKLSRGIRSCHGKWSLQSSTSVTWNLQPFHGFCVGGSKHRHHKARNPCACHAKGIVSEPLQIHHACQHFYNPHELLRLPRILQRVEIPASTTRKPLWTSKNVPRPSVFNDFDFQIALARRRGANFAKLNFQKRSEHAAWCLFFAEIALARRRGANFAKLHFQKRSELATF